MVPSKSMRRAGGIRNDERGLVNEECKSQGPNPKFKIQGIKRYLEISRERLVKYISQGAIISLFELEGKIKTLVLSNEGSYK